MNKQLFLQTQITDEELKAEVERRKKIKHEAEVKRRKERVACFNCIYQIKGYQSTWARGKTTVCSKRRKFGDNVMAKGSPVPTYYVCDCKYYDNCEFFKHK